MTLRGVFVVGFAVALFSSFGCGGGGDNGGAGPTGPALNCTEGSSGGPNTVTMGCGGLINSMTERVDVVIEGPGSGTTTLRGLNFDVTYDPAKLEFVSWASATNTLFPDALILAGLNEEGRLIVGIQQPGDKGDVAVAAGVHPVINLSFRRKGTDTFDPTPVSFDRAIATAAVPAVTFANGLSVAYQ